MRSPAYRCEDSDINTKTIAIVRHAQALHNVQRGYPHRDPALTPLGIEAASKIEVPFEPDLIVVSPMRRAIQTALLAFPELLHGSNPLPIEVWPDLREAHDAICNQGSPVADLKMEFPVLDFSECMPEWNYEAHTPERAAKRAERVRRRLLQHVAQYIVCVTHRGFIAHLVEADTFKNCEVGCFSFVSETKAGKNDLDMTLKVDALLMGHSGDKSP
jgi:broad specificity phosphatase PhoE